VPDGGAQRRRRELLVPLVRDAIRSIDVERRVIDVDREFLGEA
jgi:ribosomal 30S subunit maturation factor RimM